MGSSTEMPQLSNTHFSQVLNKYFEVKVPGNFQK